MLYKPTRFNSNDTAKALVLMQKYPFATMVFVKDGQASFSHLPVTSKLIGEKIVMIGHLAKANPQWKLLSSETNGKVSK